MGNSDSGSTAPTNSSHPDSSLTTVGRILPWAIPLMLLMAGLLLYLPGLGSYGPLDPTDSFFIESGRELFETNNYLLPLHNYRPWLDKPILYFWAVAGSYHLLGVNPFAGRLISALSAVVLGLSTYFFSRPYIGRKEAAAAALIFMSFPLACAIGHLSLTDMPLAALMGIALQALYHFEKSRQFSACLVTYLALALAFLCKGPIAIIIVAAVYGLYLLLTTANLNQLVGKIRQARPFLGLAIIAVVNLPWYAMAAAETKGLFLREFFITQNFGRMAGVVNHQQPAWFYLPVLLGGLFPWSWLALTYLARELTPSALAQLEIKGKTFLANRDNLDEKNAYLVLNSVWAGLVICLFSAIKTKLPTYILPALPAIAVLFAVLLERLENKQSKILIVWCALIVATIGGALAAPRLTSGWVHLFLQNEQPILIAALVAAVLCTILLLRRNFKIALALLLCATVAITALLVPLAHIAFYKERQEPFEQLIARIRNDRADIATVVVEADSLSYFLHRRVENLQDKAAGKRYMAGGHKPHYLLVPKEIPESLQWFEAAPVELAKTKNGKWTLYALD